MPSQADHRIALFWFRRDLRLSDNPGLTEAVKSGQRLILLYILEDAGDHGRPLGGASHWWLHGSLKRLSSDLAELGQTLVLRNGSTSDIVPDLVRRHGVSDIFWSRRYGWPAEQDDALAARLVADGRTVRTFAANLLFEPEAIPGKNGDGFKVFSAFWRAAQALERPRSALPRLKHLPPPVDLVDSDTLDDWQLRPTKPDWSGGLRGTWEPGEAGAAVRLQTFVSGALDRYAKQRDFPSDPATSMLSPHLAFGEVSPFQIWEALGDSSSGVSKYRSELGWREFAYHTLARFPDLEEDNLRSEFDVFPWHAADPTLLHAWQHGQTGYPIVDAGMRQLWQTGWMHNRVRMVVASFLTKHLLMDWRVGETWFWDTLVDADPANNPFGWQWVSGSGFDAQPYFRIFNPVLQGEKFDPNGDYVRHFVPELADLPARFVHRPWEMSPLEARAAGMVLGKAYPQPIIDHSAARQRALDAYSEMKR
ncbi:cryptochrome/photolyase family protein [Bauldia sp.]|uniref:cryptochrome/photolyase family protein n=1 Tax=Bauldia sp. TaxID=2575872 RepID=UPI003BACC2CB